MRQQQNVAVYGLSGDPATNGHLRVIEYGSRNFDRLYVVLANNPQKRYSFTPADRLQMMREITAGMEHVEVVFLPESRLLVKFAASKGASTLLRGIRNNSDHDYEAMMADFNEWVEPGIRTVYIGPTPGEPFVSSTFVKDLVGMEDWIEYVAALVPSCVMPFLHRWEAGRRAA